MIINGDGGYGLQVAYIGGLAAQAGWLGPKVGGHLALLLYSSREPSELSQWLCSYDDCTINIVFIIIINYYRQDAIPITKPTSMSSLRLAGTQVSK